MFVAFPIITLADGTTWAVTVITWRCHVGQYDLRLRNGYEDKFITIDKDDYEGLLGPDNNPQQSFQLQGT